MCFIMISATVLWPAVCLLGAGLAELCITVLDPSGQTIPFDVEPIENGQRVTYIPDCPGTHKVNATYGGINVPGCPIRQEIETVTKATACGLGLEMGIVDRNAEFVVDVKGETGELFVEVRGPRSIAHTTIEPDSGKNWRVRYMPAEVGVHTITMFWNDVEVDCSPFHPKIIDPTKVEVVVECMDHWTAVDRLMVYVDEMYNLVFDCGAAGPGSLTATITGPRGDLQDFDLLPYNTDADNNSDMFVLKFLPRTCGDYYIRAYWCSIPIQLFPVIATAVVPEPPVDCCEVRPELVSVSGPGISFAYCHENADFVIDGHEAGPGVHGVQMTGLKCDIEVSCVPLEEGVFGCSYVPEVPGAYLLSVLWNGQHAPGSPFKVSVAPSCDASKVTCSGDALTSIANGREGSVLIDTRAAGPGELIARCTGPRSMAICTLLDRRDGTYELIIQPQELGTHNLEITYGSEPIPGSPFCLKVTAHPNASKVRVSGDGIKSGLLATYQSTFVVDTRGAGPGQLTVKVRGRKGAFRVETTRLPGSERSIQCRYYPTEIGIYYVYVLWSGEHVPGSPFRVNIVDTVEELRKLAEQLEISVGPDSLLSYDTTRSRSSTSSRDGNTLRGLMFTDDY